MVVNSWAEVTKERLEKEWERISSVPPHHWDWRRLFADHWLERVDYPNPRLQDKEIFYELQKWLRFSRLLDKPIIYDYDIQLIDNIMKKYSNNG